ncbi:MAG: hypothetical protein SGPRY_004523 [Prymnesium sp.]
MCVHPNEKESSVSEADQLFRWRVVESCMHAGIPMAKIDEIRIPLERGGTTTLTSSPHLKAFIPKIEELEFRRLVGELQGK